MDSESYRGLKKLGISQIVKYILILVLWEGVTLLLFFLYHNKTGAKFTDPSGIFWVIMMMAPLAFKIHKRIFDISWSGEVRVIKDPSSAERQSYLQKSYAVNFLMKNRGYEVRVVTVSTGTHGNRDIILVGDDTGLGDSYYHVGDKVSKFAGLKYPVNYTTTRNEKFCPICGALNNIADDRCYACKHKLIDPKREHR